MPGRGRAARVRRVGRIRVGHGHRVGGEERRALVRQARRRGRRVHVGVGAPAAAPPAPVPVPLPVPVPIVPRTAPAAPWAPAPAVPRPPLTLADIRRHSACQRGVGSPHIVAVLTSRTPPAPPATEEELAGRPRRSVGGQTRVQQGASVCAPAALSRQVLLAHLQVMPVGVQVRTVTTHCAPILRKEEVLTSVARGLAVGRLRMQILTKISLLATPREEKGARLRRALTKAAVVASARPGLFSSCIVCRARGHFCTKVIPTW